jgi:hypothetical protein
MSISSTSLLPTHPVFFKKKMLTLCLKPKLSCICKHTPVSLFQLGERGGNWTTWAGFIVLAEVIASLDSFSLSLLLVCLLSEQDLLLSYVSCLVFTLYMVITGSRFNSCYGCRCFDFCFGNWPCERGFMG